MKFTQIKPQLIFGFVFHTITTNQNQPNPFLDLEVVNNNNRAEPFVRRRGIRSCYFPFSVSKFSNLKCRSRLFGCFPLKTSGGFVKRRRRGNFWYKKILKKIKKKSSDAAALRPTTASEHHRPPSAATPSSPPTNSFLERSESFSL